MGTQLGELQLETANNVWQSLPALPRRGADGAYTRTFFRTERAIQTWRLVSARQASAVDFSPAEER